MLEALATQSSPRAGSAVWCTYSPCEACAHLLVDAGVTSLVFSRFLRNPTGLSWLLSQSVRVFQYCEGMVVELAPHAYHPLGVLAGRDEGAAGPAPASVGVQRQPLHAQFQSAVSRWEQYAYDVSRLRRLNEELGRLPAGAPRERLTIAVARASAQLEWDELVLLEIERDGLAQRR